MSADASIRTNTLPGRSSGVAISLKVRVPPSRSNCHAFMVSPVTILIIADMLFFGLNQPLLLSPHIPEPILQPMRRDTQPVSEAQRIYKERRTEDAVLNVASAGDGERRLQDHELPCLLNSPDQFNVLKQRPVRSAADGMKNVAADEDALVAGGGAAQPCAQVDAPSDKAQRPWTRFGKAQIECAAQRL